MRTRRTKITLHGVHKDIGEGILGAFFTKYKQVKKVVSGKTKTGIVTGDKILQVKMSRKIFWGVHDILTRTTASKTTMNNFTSVNKSNNRNSRSQNNRSNNIKSSKNSKNVSNNKNKKKQHEQQKADRRGYRDGRGDTTWVLFF